MSTRKICIIIPTHWSAQMGGSQYQAKCLLERLIQTNKFEVFYLTRRYDQSVFPDNYNIIQIAEPRGIRQYGFFLDTFNLLKILKKIRPDIIYQRVGCAYTGIAAYYAKRNNCKMVWHIAHDNDVLPFNPSRSLNIIIRFIEKKILEYGVRSTRLIIAQTNQQANYLQKYYDQSVAKVIRNFHPEPKNPIIKSSIPKIIWVANLKPWKQPEMFIRVAKDLFKKKVKAECVMIGAPANDNPEWQRGLEKEIEQLGNLKYLGNCSIDLVNSIFREAHIFINTSLYEGFANTFIQAWMRRVPVVSLNCDPDNVLKKYELGFISGSYEKLLEDVLKLLACPALKEKIGRRAQRYAFKIHSEDNINDLLRIFLDD